MAGKRMTGRKMHYQGESNIHGRGREIGRKFSRRARQATKTRSHSY